MNTRLMALSMGTNLARKRQKSLALVSYRWLKQVRKTSTARPVVSKILSFSIVIFQSLEPLALSISKENNGNYQLFTCVIAKTVWKVIKGKGSWFRLWNSNVLSVLLLSSVVAGSFRQGRDLELWGEERSGEIKEGRRKMKTLSL